MLEGNSGIDGTYDQDLVVGFEFSTRSRFVIESIMLAIHHVFRADLGNIIRVDTDEPPLVNADSRRPRFYFKSEANLSQSFSDFLTDQ
jgi:hypothetical protein